MKDEQPAPVAEVTPDLPVEDEQPAAPEAEAAPPPTEEPEQPAPVAEAPGQPCPNPSCTGKALSGGVCQQCGYDASLMVR